MFFYNADGYLRPYKAIETTLEEFRQEFVWNNHRQGLFEKYLEFLEELKGFRIGSFYQFIGGSFVSRKEFPGDIDLTTIVNFEKFRLMKSRFSNLKWEYGEWLDLSFVEFYPKGHKLVNINLILEDEVYQLYGSTRTDAVTKLCRPKGYLKIQF